MVDVTLFFLAAGLILIFGFLAEFLFKKLRIPDVLFLIVLGFLLGPYGLDYINPANLSAIAPLFTTFTLLFLLFDGAFNISLVSLLKSFLPSFGLTFYNFIISVTAVTGIFWMFGTPLLSALLAGFILGGTSSAFVIPVLNKIKVKQKVYSLLTFESAFTDVLCIVSALALMEVIKLGTFGMKETLTVLASLFLLAAALGILGGIVWFVLFVKVLKVHNYIITIAYLLLLYVLTEFLGGNGAIAALFFGLFLKNSQQISSIVRGILARKLSEKRKAVQGDLGISAVTTTEESFYYQISFLLKTFFFVYIGMLIDFSDPKALLIGGGISLILLLVRNADVLITKSLAKGDRVLVNSIFARGLAAAAIAQIMVINNISHAPFISRVVYIVIAGTIVLSSMRIFFTLKRIPNKPEKINASS